MVQLGETTGGGTEGRAVGLSIARQAEVSEKEIHVVFVRLEEMGDKVLGLSESKDVGPGIRWWRTVYYMPFHRGIARPQGWPMSWGVAARRACGSGSGGGVAGVQWMVTQADLYLILWCRLMFDTRSMGWCGCGRERDGETACEWQTELFLRLERKRQGVGARQKRFEVGVCECVSV